MITISGGLGKHKYKQPHKELAQVKVGETYSNFLARKLEQEPVLPSILASSTPVPITKPCTNNGDGGFVGCPCDDTPEGEIPQGVSIPMNSNHTYTVTNSIGAQLIINPFKEFICGSFVATLTVERGNTDSIVCIGPDDPFDVCGEIEQGTCSTDGPDAVLNVSNEYYFVDKGAGPFCKTFCFLVE